MFRSTIRYTGRTQILSGSITGCALGPASADHENSALARSAMVRSSNRLNVIELMTTTYESKTSLFTTFEHICFHTTEFDLILWGFSDSRLFKKF